MMLAALGLNALLPGLRIIAQPASDVVAPQAVRASTIRIPVRSDSRLWLEGSSNVRDWTCKATQMDATIDIDNANAQGRLVRAVAVKVPVRMLKCGDRHMEAHMYSALKAPSPPEVGYITASFERIPEMTRPGDSIDTDGQLTVAG